MTTKGFAEFYNQFKDTYLKRDLDLVSTTERSKLLRFYELTQAFLFDQPKKTRNRFLRYLGGYIPPDDYIDYYCAVAEQGERTWRLLADLPSNEVQSVLRKASLTKLVSLDYEVLESAILSAELLSKLYRYRGGGDIVSEPVEEVLSGRALSKDFLDLVPAARHLHEVKQEYHDLWLKLYRSAGSDYIFQTPADLFSQAAEMYLSKPSYARMTALINATRSGRVQSWVAAVKKVSSIRNIQTESLEYSYISLHTQIGEEYMTQVPPSSLSPLVAAYEQVVVAKEISDENFGLFKEGCKQAIKEGTVGEWAEHISEQIKLQQ